MLIRKVLDLFKSRSERAQSFVELAIVLPFLLLILLGLVEVVFFIARYMDVVDLTREAARVASTRDPEIGEAFTPGAYTCAPDSTFNFYWATACVFSPPADSGPDPSFRGGMNPFVYLDPSVDDLVITVFTVNNKKDVVDINPTGGYWAFSDHDSDTTHNENWKKDCQGNPLPPIPGTPPATPAPRTPHFTKSSLEEQLVSDSPPNKGFVSVEFYYCYHQVLNLPIYNWFIPSPMRIHAYTLMPLPAAAPTPTP